MRTLLHTNSAIGKRLEKFGLALKASPPLLLRSRQLIFLCGANQSENVPSARRAKIRSFIQQISSGSTVLYAEGIFKELQKFGSQKNVLDIEHRISEIADKVIVILESPSSYCELGAFAHEALRHKLVVINDSQFKTSKSFINLGPIAAMEEKKAPVLWYPMSSNGVKVLDGIGAIFPELEKAIDHKSNHGTPVSEGELAELKMNKISLYFVHDIVLLAGPISHEEIIQILIFLFGKKSFDPLKSLLGVLRESQLVRVKSIGEDMWVYEAQSTDFFLRYKTDIYALVAAFRVRHLREAPERFGVVDD
ncbi:MAG: retron St85 family effector protein [Ramlibacter sp.]|nr:retron St85 family effector protein [Ramlibacter sp.]